MIDSIAQGDVLEQVSIQRVGAAAEAFDAATAFETFKASKAEREAAAKAAEEKALEEATSGMTKTASGLYYTITKEGTGPQPETGANVAVHYRGMLMDGTVLIRLISVTNPLRFP